MRIAVLAVALLSVGAHGGVYTGIETDVSALPKKKAFIGRLVRSRVWDRMMPSTFNKKADLKVMFVIDESLGGENAAVKVANGRAEVRGARFRALVAGAGVMMRAMRFNGTSFELADGEYRFSPAKPFRQVYFARHFENWYHRASTELIVRYFEDLMLWGMNALHDPIAYPVCESLKANDVDRASFRATSLALSRRAEELDVDLTVSGGSNAGPRTMDAKYRSQHHYKGKGSTQYNICPERPGALDYLVKLRTDHNRQCEGLRITGCRYMPYDEGGCHCDKCYPWGGNGYIKLIERFRDVNKSLNPNLKHIVSTWMFDREDWKRFYAYLEKQDWIDCIMADSGSDFPKYLRENPLPKDIPVVTFPEISMYGRFPWGGTGANPQPARFERLFRQAEKIVSGFSLYSEGIYEDVNKIVINGLYVDPSRTVDSILAEYANWELPGSDPADFISFVKKLESIYPMRIKGRKGIAGVSVTLYLRDAPGSEISRRAAVAKEAFELAKKIDGGIIPRCRRNWRWRQLYLRAQIDESIYRTRNIRNPDAVLAYGELIDLYNVHRQVTELYENRYGGVTAPPMMDPGRIRREGAAFLKEKKMNKKNIKDKTK